MVCACLTPLFKTQAEDVLSEKALTIWSKIRYGTQVWYRNLSVQVVLLFKNSLLFPYLKNYFPILYERMYV